MSLFSTPPRRVCILRLSALGDTCHVVPLLRALQRAWPDTEFTWIIGKAEARLMTLIEGVEFITVDKRVGILKMRRELRATLGQRRFDLLLHLQLAMRASLLAQIVRADIKLGYDRARARELQWWFTNAQIAAQRDQHVVDLFLSFAQRCGVEIAQKFWNVPLPDEALHYASQLIPEGKRTLVISPCSSHAQRNWSAERYAAVAHHAILRHGLQVILVGGPSATERAMGEAIEQIYARHPAVPGLLRNQIAKDTLPQLLALLSRCRVLLSPDSGPVHMATLVGTPVIGLYAATRLARSGPYLSQQWCVDAYPEAAQRFRDRDATDLPWHAKIEESGVMDLIPVTEVTRKLDELLE
jgi:heptosyltransferase I